MQSFKTGCLPSISLLSFIQLVLTECLLCARHAAGYSGYSGERKQATLREKAIVALTVRWTMVDMNPRVPQINVLWLFLVLWRRLTRYNESKQPGGLPHLERSGKAFLRRWLLGSDLVEDCGGGGLGWAVNIQDWAGWKLKTFQCAGLYSNIKQNPEHTCVLYSNY